MSTLQPHSNATSRRGFTLVELLVAIGLISFVAGMFLVAYRGAAAEATNIRTASTIRKISAVLTARMQEYDNLAISFERPLPSNAVPILPTTDVNYESTTILMERARLSALRELICLEMPDHPDDNKWTVAWRNAGQRNAANRATGLAFPTPSGAIFSYVRLPYPLRATRIRQKLTVGGNPIPDWEARNANAELLYLIVEDSTMNGSSAIELFGKSEIGDTDGDGLSELLDANRRPIQWIRWPSGFPSILRYHPDLLDPTLIDPVTKVSRFTGDSFDRMRADPGFRITSDPVLKALRPDVGTFPLVVSSGTDGQFGLRFEIDPAAIESIWNGATPMGQYTTHRFDPSLPRSRSVGDVQFPTPYRAAFEQFLATGSGRESSIMPDPWYPRLRPPASTIDLSSQRLGAIINPKAFEDDITNYDSNGASL
jgi:prepilin-type N-terminal cleavage/methylation domain-containing protein